MRIMNLKNDVCDDKYFSLFAIKAEAEKIHNLALELEMDKDTKEKWRQYAVLCNVLIEQLKQRPHQDAIKDLKLVFGGNRGLSEANEKLTKKILKSSNASMALNVAPNWGHQPVPMMMGPPMGHPQQFFGYGQPNMPHPNFQGDFQGNFQGGCYNCGQFGHMAKNCFSNRGPSNFHARGCRGSGSGRAFGGRFNHRGERKRGRN